MAISRYIENDGIALYDLVEQQELEGIVAKRKDSIYIPGKQTKDWIKIKYLQDDDFVICGYIFKDNSMVSLVLGQYLNGKLLYKGHVTLGKRGKPFQIIQKTPILPNAPLPFPSGHGNERAVWVNPELVCTVSYMKKTEAGNMRQPVFKGLRYNKIARDCASQ